MPFELAGSVILAGVIDCACAVTAPQSLLLRRRGEVLDPFGRPFWGTASQICHLWVLAAGGGPLLPLGQGQGLLNHSLTDTRSTVVVAVAVGNDEWGGAAWKQ